jgi:L-alanine-DL-glutamate epimerase-like enolase superfamily enzyme
MIKDLQTAVVEANYDWTFVKIITDDGIGYGECFFAPGLTKLLHDLRPLLLRQDPRNIHRLLRIIRTAALLASPHGGIAHHALAGIETALWDLLGKQLGVPVYRLWGGTYRSHIRLYADCHAGEGLASLSAILAPRIPWWMTESGETEVFQEIHPKYHGGRSEEALNIDLGAYARRARQAVDQGYTALKFDLDIPNPHSKDNYNRVVGRQEIGLLEQLVKTIRDEVGDEVELTMDCHWNFNAESAIALAQALAPYQLLWLEDPVPPESDVALARVTQQSPVPIATGENHFYAAQFARLLELGLQVAAPDFQKTGLWEGRRIAEVAEIYSAPVAPHNISSPLGTLASAHLCATLPNLLALEHHGMDVPFWEELVQGRDGPIIQNGYVVLEERPGLGVELNEEVAYRYRKRDEVFFEQSEPAT